jgi:hypothetical protein
MYKEYVQLISKLSSTPQKSRSRFVTIFFTCKDAFLKFERHIFYIPGDQEGLFKLAIQLRKFLFITL